MYTLDEVLPHMYDDIQKDPTLKNGLFGNDIDNLGNNTDEEEFLDQMNDLMHDPGNCTLTLSIPKFGNFEAKTFKLQVTKSEKIHDDYCEGKAWSHYDTYFTDVDTGQKYCLTSEYYETNGDLIGLYIDKIKTPVKKAKKVKTMFVVVQRTPEDYNILGIFDSVEKAVEAEDGNQNRDVQIEEVPINCKLTFTSNDADNMITGALNVFDIQGNVR